MKTQLSVSSMPFYGTIIFEIECGNPYSTRGLTRVEYTVGAETRIDGVSSGGCIGEHSELFSNIPMGTPVSLTIKKCIEGILQNVSYVLFDISIEPTLKKYGIRALSPCSLYCDIGKIVFRATTPRSCGTLPTCTYQEPNDVDTIGILTSSYNYVDAEGNQQNRTLVCNPNDVGISGTVSWHLPDTYEWNIQPCYNGVNKVNFSVSFFKNGIGTETVPFVYIYDICPVSANNTLLNDVTVINILTKKEKVAKRRKVLLFINL